MINSPREPVEAGKVEIVEAGSCRGLGDREVKQT